MSFYLYFKRLFLFVAVFMATAVLWPTTTLAAVSPATRAVSNAGLEAQVRDYFADIPVMIEIARCESEFHQYGKGGRPLHGGTGTMIGLYQISEILHREVADDFDWDIDTPEGNMSYARYLYENRGTAPWLDSKPCWNAPASAARYKAAAKALTLKQQEDMSSTTVSSADATSTLASIQERLITIFAKLSEIQVQQKPDPILASARI